MAHSIDHYLGLTPHPENAAKAKDCLEAGGSWSDDPPDCLDLPDTSSSSDAAKVSNWTGGPGLGLVVVGVAVIGSVAAAVGVMYFIGKGLAK